MKAMKQHETTYNALSGCLEAHFGDRRTSKMPARRKHREPAAGLHTVLFKSCPLQLNYMRRRTHSPLIRFATGN